MKTKYKLYLWDFWTVMVVFLLLLFSLSLSLSPSLSLSFFGFVHKSYKLLKKKVLAVSDQQQARASKQMWQFTYDEDFERVLFDILLSISYKTFWEWGWGGNWAQLSYMISIHDFHFFKKLCLRLVWFVLYLCRDYFCGFWRILRFQDYFAE